jgi:hypothetical protein
VDRDIRTLSRSAAAPEARSSTAGASAARPGCSASPQTPGRPSGSPPHTRRRPRAASARRARAECRLGARPFGRQGRRRRAAVVGMEAAPRGIPDRCRGPPEPRWDLPKAHWKQGGDEPMIPDGTFDISEAFAGGWWILSGPLFWLLFIVAIALLIRGRTGRSPSTGDDRETGIDVLERRFAEGEQRRSVLEEKRRRLEPPTQPPNARPRTMRGPFVRGVRRPVDREAWVEATTAPPIDESCRSPWTCPTASSTTTSETLRARAPRRWS